MTRHSKSAFFPLAIPISIYSSHCLYILICAIYGLMAALALLLPSPPSSISGRASTHPFCTTHYPLARRDSVRTWLSLREGSRNKEKGDSPVIARNEGEIYAPPLMIALAELSPFLAWGHSTEECTIQFFKYVSR